MSAFRCRGDHTETVDIEYNPEQTTYKKLLDIFWGNHEPTSYHTRQYMSAIFCHTKEQRTMAEQSMEEEQRRKFQPIKTRILDAEFFYNAEE